MLAIANWTSQIPCRPPLPDGCHLSQLIALGSRRRKSKVYWMLAKSEAEVGDWIAAIAKTVRNFSQTYLCCLQINFIVVSLNISVWAVICLNFFVCVPYS